MTDEDLAMMKRELDAGADRLAYLNAVHEAAVRLAAEREQAAARDAVRAPLYARAADAAHVWLRFPFETDGAQRVRFNNRSYQAEVDRKHDTLAREARRFQRHAVDLAADDITIEWLRPDSRSETLVTPNNAQAHIYDKTVVCPPILDAASYAVVLHEIGHLRARTDRSTLLSEVSAWRWAREHALLWTDEAQERMRRALGSYMSAAQRSDVLGVLEAERFSSGLEYRRERQRRLMLELSGRAC